MYSNVPKGSCERCTGPKRKASCSRRTARGKMGGLGPSARRSGSRKKAFTNGIYRPNYKDWSGLAVSEDGIHWEKPILGLTAYEGSKQNNLVSNRRIHKVVRDPHEPDPSSRYKGLAKNTPVVSEDLVHWRDAGVPDVPGDDSGSVTYDEQQQRFLAPVKISDASKESFRQFELVTSEDFQTWSDARYFFGADEKDQEIAIHRIRRWLSDPGRPRPLFVEPPPHLGWTPPKEIRELPKRRHSWNAQCNNVSVFPYQGQYIALITMLYPTGAYLPDYKNTMGFFMVEVASSRDLKTWNRLREPFFTPARLDQGIAENYERMLVQPVNRPVVREDELWFYYNGGKAHGFARRYATYMDGTARDPESLSDVERRDIEAGQSALYLATLRLDGFVSLDADAEAGYVLTKPLTLAGDDLYLNLACKDGGSATVELLDEDEKPIAVSKEVAGDNVRLPVIWKEQVDLASLKEKRIRIKICLQEAELYAFWAE